MAARRRAGVVVLAFAVVWVGCLSLVAGDADSGSSKPFVGNFEVASPGWQQFSGLQYEPDRPLQDSFGLVADPVRSGAHAARITVPQGYSLFGFNESTQLVHFSNEQPGDDYWYAFSVNFPRDWFAPYGWGIFAEWHAPLETSPVIAFDARADTAEFNFHAGLTNEQANTFQYDINRPLLATLSLGKWNDFVMHVRWSKTNGEVEIWHKLGWQQRFKRLIRLAGMPTFQWTSAGKGIGIYLLFGLYRRSYCPQPTQIGCTSSRGVQPPNTLYLDSYARATSFEAVTQAAYPQERVSLCDSTPRSRILCKQRKPGVA